MWKRCAESFYKNAICIRSYVNNAGKLRVRSRIKAVKGKISTAELPIETQRLAEIRPKMKDFNTSKEYEEDPEGFGDLESDFLQVHYAEDGHETEVRMRKQKIKQWIIQRKYFKQNMPNFLTYAEKEQIKLLNSSCPDEWTPEKLSESFPADLETIKKILKAKWTARTEKRIQMHDKNVMRNWDLLEKGNFDNFSVECLDHLKRFINSRKNVTNETVQKCTFKLPKPKTTEFVSIVKKYESCADGQNEENKEENLISENVALPLENDFIDNKNYYRKMRLEELRSEGLIPPEVANITPQPKTESLENMFHCPNQAVEIVMSQNEIRTYQMDSIKERIYIPRKLWKEGATYKVHDCYYDNDGMLLYRVPGMTGRKV